VSLSSVAHAKFSNPTVGIVEGSAIGTIAGPLACQLVKHGIVKDGTMMVIEQGYEMKRPSLLRVEVHNKEVRRLAGAGSKSLKDPYELSKQIGSSGHLGVLAMRGTVEANSRLGL
jgi:predicted PhzF superfamily epimerase YddE/YHI9